jgi:MFS family permease
VRSIKIYAILMFISIASSSAVIITPALPQITQDLALANGSVEWLVNTFLMGYVIGQIIYSPIAAKYGDVGALKIGLIINLFGVLICIVGAHVNSFNILMIGRFISALGASAGFVCTLMIIKRMTTPAQMKHVFAFVPVSFALGIGVATLIGSSITYHISWKYCFYILFAHGLVMLALSFIYQNYKTNKSTQLTDILIGYKKVLNNKRLVIFSLCLGISSSFNYCYATVGGFISKYNLHITIAEYGYWNILTMVGIMLGGLTCASIIHKFETFKLLAFTILVTIISFITISILNIAGLNNALMFFTIITFIYFITSFIFPLASSLALKDIDDAEYASGAISFVNMMTAMVCVIIMSYLPLSNMWSFITTCSAICIICLFGIFIVRERKEKKENNTI